MTSVFFPGVTTAPTADQTSSQTAEATSSGGEEKTMTRADFSGLLALFASAQQEMGGAAERTTVTTDSWAMETEAEEGWQESSSNRSESEGPAAASGTPGASPGASTRMGTPLPADPDETRQRVVLVDEGSAPIPVAWARDLGVPMNAPREAQEPNPPVHLTDVEGMAPRAQGPDPTPQRDVAPVIPAAPEVVRATQSSGVSGHGVVATGVSADGLREADVDLLLPRTESIDPGPRQVPQEGPPQVPERIAAQDAPVVSDEAHAVQSTGVHASAVSVEPVFAAQASVPTGPVAEPALDGLHPELRQKVLRVIERMAAEYGHTVEVVEGYRTPERQRQLYAQGRSAPGPIVTWTSDSRHSEGLAVDLRVDGTWNAPEAYAHLQRIAREEGLGTLGMRDPGHLEFRMDDEGRSRLAREDRPPSNTGSMAEPRTRSRRPGLARAARVASVADVAKVARPARVPTPGTPVSVRGQAPAFAIPVEPAPIHEPNPVDVMIPESVGDARVVSMSPQGGASAPAHQGGMPGVGSVSESRADPMARVRRVLDAQEALEVMGSSRVSVRLDGMAGPVEQIRVSLADRALDTWIDVREGGSANDMRAGLADLYRALEGRGFDPGTLAVNSVAGREAASQAALSTRGDVAAGVLRTFIDAMTAPPATRAGSGQGHQQRHQASEEGRSGQEGFARSPREDSRENRRNEK